MLSVYTFSIFVRIKIRSIYLFSRHMHTLFGMIAAGIFIPKTIKNKINVSLIRGSITYVFTEIQKFLECVLHFPFLLFIYIFIYDSLLCNKFCRIQNKIGVNAA